MLIESVLLYSCSCKLEDGRCDNEKESLTSPFLNGGIEIGFLTVCTVVRGDLPPFGKTLYSPVFNSLIIGILCDKSVCGDGDGHA